jgi:hypothetical protein
LFFPYVFQQGPARLLWVKVTKDFLSKRSPERGRQQRRQRRRTCRTEQSIRAKEEGVQTAGWMSSLENTRQVKGEDQGGTGWRRLQKGRVGMGIVTAPEDLAEPGEQSGWRW